MLAFSLYALTTSGEIEFGDGVVLYDVTQAIVDHGTIRIDRDLGDWGARPGYSYFGSGLSVAAVPFDLLGKLAAYFSPRADPDRMGRLFAALGVCFFAALIAPVFFRLAFRLGADARAALWATLMLTTTTSLWSCSSIFTREPLAALTLLLCVERLYDPEGRGGWLRLAEAGAAFVATIWTRFDLAVTAPFLVGYLLVSRLRPPRARKEVIEAARSLGALLAAPVLAAPVFFYFNHLKFGGWLSFGYAGHSLTATPLRLGLAGLLASPMHGLLVYCPAIVFGLWGLTRLRERDRPLLVLLAALPAFLLVFYAKFSVWSGAFSVGPRFLLPALPLAMLPTAFVLRARTLQPSGIAAAIVIALYGAAAQLILTLGDWVVFFGRLTAYWGRDGLFLLPLRFAIFPVRGFWEQLGEGRFNPVWLNLPAARLPAWLLVLPAALLAAGAIAAWRLLRPSALDSSASGWRAAPRARKLAFAASACAVWLFAGLFVFQRAAWPRGLELRLFADAVDQGAPLLALRGQRPTADVFDNPFLKAMQPTSAAEWTGWLRVPSHTAGLDHFYLAANAPARVEIDGQSVFQALPPTFDKELHLVRDVQAAKGYHPITVTFARPPDEPYFTLRWTLHDHAFQDPIPLDCLFAAEPSPLGRALIEFEFYLLLGLAAALFFFLRETAALRSFP